MVVERTFGIWKRRFPCLSRGSLKLIIKTINMYWSRIDLCSFARNLSLHFKDVLPEEPEPNIAIKNNEEPYNEPHWQPGDGHIIRQNLVRQLFH